MLTSSSLASSLCTRCLRQNLREGPPLASRSYLRPLARSANLRTITTTTSRRVFAPVDPASLPKAAPAKQYRRLRKWARRFGYLGIFTGLVLGTDRYVYSSALTRSLRTFLNGAYVALDYKINFREDPPFARDIQEVHERSARRLFELLRANGGLYMKIGQAIAMQSAVLPPEFQKMFARMFDDAPQNDWDDVKAVIQEDFGKSPEEVFGVSFTGDPSKGLMEKKARASASVAQVHWARLADGREVAIKVQKREIADQVGWDLWAFKVVAKIYTWSFDIPMYNLVPYITERLMLECDFQNEAQNSRNMAKCVESEPRLRDRVYIPEVYDDLTSKRVMTAEWIEGVRLWDKDGITKSWKGGWRTGSPGTDGKPLPFDETQNRPSNPRDYLDHLKPDRSAWKGSDGKGGLGLNLKEVMTTMVDLFSAQMFIWGYVHCDPHPGNIFIRRLPNGRSQLVLIDHGLYINMNPEFRHQYSLFWKSIMTFDNKTIGEVVKEWGINNGELFASATLMKPYKGGSGVAEKKFREISNEKDKKKRQYEMQQAMRKGIREILADEKKWPRELIFIGRNMRIVQGNNQYLGSPVNRIKITGNWASKALTEDPNLTFGQRIKFWGQHLLFQSVLFTTDLYFYYAKIKQYFGKGKGMDDDIEKQMQRMAGDYGVELQHSVFDG